MFSCQVFDNSLVLNIISSSPLKIYPEIFFLMFPIASFTFFGDPVSLNYSPFLPKVPVNGLAHHVRSVFNIPLRLEEFVANIVPSIFIWSSKMITRVHALFIVCFMSPLFSVFCTFSNSYNLLGFFYFEFIQLYMTLAVEKVLVTANVLARISISWDETIFNPSLISIGLMVSSYVASMIRWELSLIWPS